MEQEPYPWQIKQKHNIIEEPYLEVAEGNVDQLGLADIYQRKRQAATESHLEHVASIIVFLEDCSHYSLSSQEIYEAGRDA